MDALLADGAELAAVIECLAKLGFAPQGDLGIPEREAFRSPDRDISHNLYVCPPGSRKFQRHLSFRDYLRGHSAEAASYAELPRHMPN
jgi:GrpB-like predicted nucleotidyltransferase (UPF0157 family)